MSESWPKVPLKYLVTKIGSGKTPKGGAEVYTASGVMLLRSQNVHIDGLRLDDVVFIDEGMDEDMASTRVQPNDVLLNITGASIGRCTVVPMGFSAANVNQHVCIIRPDKKRLMPEFLNLVLQSPEIQNEIRFGENGSSREGLNFEQVGAFEIPLPDLSLQRACVTTAGASVELVERLIGVKRHLQDLLHEKRRALIAYTVVRGLNADRPLRESGAPWGELMPIDWTLQPLRRLVKSMEQGWSPLASTIPANDDEFGVLKLSAIKAGRFLSCENKALLPGDELPKELAICARDVFISRANTPSLVGDAAMAEGDYPRLLFSDLIYRVRVHAETIMPEWLVLVLVSEMGRRQIESEAKGSSGSMVKLSQDQVLGLLVPVPPYAEQVALVQEVRRETGWIDSLFNQTSIAIDLLRERRVALIAQAVTTGACGK